MNTYTKISFFNHDIDDSIDMFLADDIHNKHDYLDATVIDVEENLQACQLPNGIVEQINWEGKPAILGL